MQINSTVSYSNFTVHDMCTTRAIYSSFIVFLLRLFFILIAYERNVSDEREYSAYVYYVRNVKKKKKNKKPVRRLC